MHTLLHPHLMQAGSPATPPPGLRPPPRPRRIRGGAARVLASAASRLDRESARRALA